MNTALLLPDTIEHIRNIAWLNVLPAELSAELKLPTSKDLRMGGQEGYEATQLADREQVFILAGARGLDRKNNRDNMEAPV